MAAAVRLAAGVVVGGAQAPSHHRRRARRGRQDPAADPARGTLCLPPVLGECVGDQGADQPVHTTRAAQTSTAPSTTSPAARNWPAKPATTVWRSWAARAICSTSSSRRAPTSARTRGAARPRSADDSPSRSCAAAARRSAPDFIICYRMSMADYVEDGQSWDEIIALATEVEAAGATMINSGFGWHEARVPTIVTSVPNSAFVDISSAVAEHVDIPVVASNRINMPQAAEQILADTHVQLISMARPAAVGSELGRQGAGRCRRRDQHVHLLQSGLPRPRVRAQEGVVSAQPARRPGDRPGARADAPHPPRGGCRRGTRGSGHRGAPPPNAATR